MKKFIVMMAVVAFSALAFADDAPSTAPAAGGAPATGDAMKSGDTKSADAAAKKVAKKGKHKKAKAAKTDDKAM